VRRTESGFESHDAEHILTQSAARNNTSGTGAGSEPDGDCSDGLNFGLTGSRLGGDVKGKTRTEITVETDEVLIIRFPGLMSWLWCAECGETVTMATPDQAVVLTSESARSIYQRAQMGVVHSLETNDGLLLICLKSLSKAGSGSI
jgi:hypothetical protein